MTEPGSWQELHDQFFAAVGKVETDPSSADWRTVWHLVACHAWVQQRLATIAGAVLRRSQIPADLKNDLVHDALIILAARLQRSPDLHFDRTRDLNCFCGWMNTVLTHSCQQAARSVRRYYRRVSQMPVGDFAESDCRRREERVAMSQTLDDVREPAGTVLRLYVKGHTLRGIARLLDIPYWEVRQLFHDGEVQLRRGDQQD